MTIIWPILFESILLSIFISMFMSILFLLFLPYLCLFPVLNYRISCLWNFETWFKNIGLRNLNVCRVFERIAFIKKQFCCWFKLVSNFCSGKDFGIKGLFLQLARFVASHFSMSCTIPVHNNDLCSLYYLILGTIFSLHIWFYVYIYIFALVFRLKFQLFQFMWYIFLEIALLNTCQPCNPINNALKALKTMHLIFSSVNIACLNLTSL